MKPKKESQFWLCVMWLRERNKPTKRLIAELQGVVYVELFHGRFNMQDRMGKEKTIREKTGTNSDKRSSVVLVATQVVEVSLDIDLNTIYTDPAPLEALVQRFGCINRGR
jgi:CRISPR/Cas system-associated endonuclease/helicase Cas3